MKKVLFAGITLAMAVGLASFCFAGPKAPPPVAIKWYTWQEAQDLQKTAPKKLFIDVYTEWCGWCKRMDKTTLVDSAVAVYLAANYYPVKFDAEQKNDIQFSGQTFKYTAENGRGVHQLAVALLDGNMSYPSYVYLNEKNERIMVSPGYKEPADLIKELKFATEEMYKTTTWEKYRDGK